MNKFQKLALVPVALMSGAAMAQSTPPDYSTLTNAVDFSSIITVVLSVAAIIVPFILVKNNIGSIMSFIRGKAK